MPHPEKSIALKNDGNDAKRGGAVVIYARAGVLYQRSSDDVEAALGGGVAVLEDPGNVWEAETEVAAGYRISMPGGGFTYVWEVEPAGGTTGVAEPDWNPTAAAQVTDNDVVWLWLGNVGQIPAAALGLDGDLNKILTGLGSLTPLIPPRQADFLADIADPGSATAEDVANKVNELLAALQDSQLMGD